MLKIHSTVLAALGLLGAILPANAQKPYFQQEVNYTIHVKLDDVKHELTGEESMEYINNSPDELTFIYIHLWPNAYKNNYTALARQLVENGETKMFYAPEKDRGYIDQLDFKVDGQPVKLEYDPKHIDIAKIILNTPLRPGAKITITTPFHVKIPIGEFSRLGHIQQQYQITQWYPKPAVYDRNGWNPMPYLDQGEFYSEFGTYDVHITLPKNYVLGATGDLVNGEKELEWLNAKVKATEALTSFDKKDLEFPASDPETKTLHFHQENVHDFAWFADKRYHVLKGEVELPHSKRKVESWVMFTSQYGDRWKKGIKYINDAIFYYSLWNGDYPYNHATAVDGALSAGGGMEYPNITVIGAVQSDMLLETVIMHEVGHNWFYGILGSNERLHPWMDEGLNSFNEHRYIETKYPEATLVGGIADNASGIEKKFHLDKYRHKEQYYLTYMLAARRNEDQPIELPSEEYISLNYGGIVYSKTAIAFDYLMAYLGETKMDEAMRLYFDTWKFKHPEPSDLRKILEQVSGKNLGWFFDDMINTTKKLDYKILDFKKAASGAYDITLKNTGDIIGPVAICGIKDGKLKGVVWYDGFDGKQVVGFPPGDYDYFKIDFQNEMPEFNRNNNTMHTHGLFKKLEPISLQFLGSLDDPDKTQLFYTPVVGWNNYNGPMVGLALYNNVIPQKKFEYVLMPMYGIKNNDIAGSGTIMYNMLPKKGPFRQVTLGVRGARYAFEDEPEMNFNKIAPEFVFDLKKKRARSHISHQLRLRSVNIIKDNNTYIFDPLTTSFTISTEEQYMINNLTWFLKGKHTINPYDAMLDVQQGDNMVKAALAVNQEISYTKNKTMHFRLFAGAFIDKPDAGGLNDYRFRISGIRGRQDYLYDHIFLGRSESDGTLSKQFADADGAFKVPTSLGQSQEWVAALNFKAALPMIPLVNVFADIGTSGEDGLLNDRMLYDAGVSLVIGKGIFEVYFPLAYSDDIRTNLEVQQMDKFMERARFVLNLNLLNPFEKLRNLSF
jgi:hypothetical protein